MQSPATREYSPVDCAASRQSLHLRIIVMNMHAMLRACEDGVGHPELTDTAPNLKGLLPRTSPEGRVCAP